METQSTKQFYCPIVNSYGWEFIVVSFTCYFKIGNTLVTISKIDLTTKQEVIDVLQSSFNKAIQNLNQIPIGTTKQTVIFRNKQTLITDLIFNTIVHQAEQVAQIVYIAKQSNRYQGLTTPYLVFSTHNEVLDKDP
jgi:F0F1-type ATP synthase alpha subunit